MKNYLNIILVIGIVALGIFISNKYFPTVIDNSTHTRDTIWTDTIRIKSAPKPYPVYIDTSSIDTVFIAVDSAAIIAQYLNLHQKFYSIYTYIDTLKDDSLAFIKIGSKITQNKPIQYTLDYFDRTPLLINNTTHIYSKNEFYVGVGTEGKGITGNLLFKSRKNYIVEVGYNPFTKEIGIRGYLKLNKIFKK